jgi:hypothetical protein
VDFDVDLHQQADRAHVGATLFDQRRERDCGNLDKLNSVSGGFSVDTLS